MGRKPIDKKRRLDMRIAVRVNLAMAARIDLACEKIYARDKRMWARSAALRHLVELGLLRLGV